MTPVIYHSSIPSVPIVSTSVYTHLFSASPNDPTSVGGYPGSSPAFIDAPSGTTLTRTQLKNLSLSFAFGIRNHPTTRANVGDTVLIYSQNSLHWPVVLFGCVAAGLRCTLANSAYNTRELTYQYNDSKAGIVFTTEAGLPVVKEMFLGFGLGEQEAHSRIIVLGESLAWAGGPNAPRQAPNLLYSEDLLGKGKLESEVRFDGERAHETLYLCYSSGTTGKPKGVETTHRNITALMDMLKPLFPPANKVLGILPFYHIYGAVKLLHFP
ncbi:acetyl-CoA synthetase-like protein, partial [Pluteus cervinus]